ncbi:MAG: hypothetical protein J5804_04630 [Eggerthellaceae bacterium]|nr:hypothetical protein [Eggerthellaceae bacterium]
MADLTADIINQQGTKLLTAKKIHVRDSKVVIDGNMMGTMPGQFYVTPLNLYKMSKMVDFATIRAVLGLLKQGKKEFKALNAEQSSK